jgi:hypothetical protein
MDYYSDEHVYELKMPLIGPGPTRHLASPVGQLNMMMGTTVIQIVIPVNVATPTDDAPVTGRRSPLLRHVVLGHQHH